MSFRQTLLVLGHVALILVGCDTSSGQLDADADVLDTNEVSEVADADVSVSDVPDTDTAMPDVFDVADVPIDVPDADLVSDVSDTDMCLPEACPVGSCGTLDDGCGGTLACGTCTLPETCGGGGDPLACGCMPTTCAAEGADCGDISDGCGNVLNCGMCTAPGDTCGGNMPNQCGPEPCVPETCSSLGVQCGPISDGCSTTLQCGVCNLPQTCAGGGVANTCGCTPTTCAAEGAECGSVPDGCGAMLICAACASDATCSANQCACNAGFHDCGGTCVADTAVTSCGTSCTSCPTDPNGTTGCNGVECTMQCDPLFHLNAAGTCSAWSSENPPFTGSEGTYSGISTDTQGRPVIAFHDLQSSGDDAIYTTLVSGVWSFDVIESNTFDSATHIELAMDGNTPHVAYQRTRGNARDIVYRWRDGMGVWNETMIETWSSFSSKTSVAFMDIEVDSSGYAWVLYATSDFVDIGGGTFANRISVNVAHDSSTGWTIDVVDDTLTTNSKVYSLELDSSDEPHITYYDWASGENRYAWHASGTWNTEVVALPGWSLGGGWMVLDSTNTPHVGYVADNRDLVYATRTMPNTWITEVVTNETALSASVMHIGVDAADRPVFAYRADKSSYEILAFATRRFGVWNVEEADNTVDAVFGHVDLHMDGNTPQVSYHSRNSDLKYATVP